MTSTDAIPVGAWYRVSTGEQDEGNQIPEIKDYCDKRHYNIVCEYPLNDKSASKGEQQAKLDAMIADMRDGTIKVLVCWHSDRLERRGPEALFALLRQVKDAGGRIESTKEPLFGSEDMSGEAMTALGAVMAHQYSVHLSEQVKLGLARAKDNGAIYNRAPWGFTTEGPKYSRMLVPADWARELIPQIFDRCLAGQSMRKIAAWLTDEGIPTPRRKKQWDASTVHDLIKNRAYAGRYQDDSGMTMAKCESIVSPDKFDLANAVLKSSSRRSGPTSKLNPPMLAKLKCARCGNPMYRTRGGHAPNFRWYYRCAGIAPQRTGCGNMVALKETEGIITDRIFMTSTEPHETRQWVEGKNWDAEISDIKQDIREVTEAEHWDELPALTAKLAEYRHLNETEAEPGHYERRKVLKPDGSYLLEGDYFDTLDTAGKREYLKTHDIRVEKVVNPPLEPGASLGIRVIINGEDQGVYPYPPAKAKSVAAS